MSDEPQRHGRQPEPRIEDPSTHPRKWVCFTVAAVYLDMDRRALNAYVDEGCLEWEWRGRMRKIHVDEVERFKAWMRERSKAS